MRSSRRDFLARSAQFGAVLGAGVPLLQACAGNGTKSASTKPIADGLEPETGPLRIVNYDSYVNPDVVADFENLYGVKVELTTIFSDTEVVTKIASGAIKVDVQHSMANTSIGNMIAGGLLQPLNKSYIPNFANVISNFNDPFYDPGARYSVPYTFFGTGIGFRADRISADDVAAQGWDTLWNATDFAGEVSVLDDEREALVMAMMRRGLLDVNTIDPNVIGQAGLVFKQLTLEGEALYEDAWSKFNAGG